MVGIVKEQTLLIIKIGMRENIFLIKKLQLDITTLTDQVVKRQNKLHIYKIKVAVMKTRSPLT